MHLHKEKFFAFSSSPVIPFVSIFPFSVECVNATYGYIYILHTARPIYYAYRRTKIAVCSGGYIIEKPICRHHSSSVASAMAHKSPKVHDYMPTVFCVSTCAYVDTVTYVYIHTHAHTGKTHTTVTCVCMCVFVYVTWGLI